MLDTMIQPQRFRETLGHYPTGVVVVTGIADDGKPVGMVVGSFTSVSLDPPLVAFLPQRDSRTFARLRTATSFCVNVLSADQEAVCRAFAGPGEDKFAGIAWEAAPSGAPIVDGVVAWIDCEFESTVEAGDHYIVIGKVTEMDVVRPALPLLFFQGGYGRFTLPSLMARAEPDLIQGVRLAEYARPEIEAIAEEFQVECSVMAAVGEDSVFVAVASRSPRPSRVSPGIRVPLVPPVGSIFISTLGSVAVNEWLSRLPAGADEQAYITRLERVRERGYSISLHGRHSETEMYDILRSYSAVDRLPEHERLFKAVIQDTVELYEPEIDPAGTYDLHSVVVPVVGPLGLVQIALRIAATPEGATGEQVLGWIARLQEAAATVAKRLTAHPPLPVEPEF